MIINLSYLEEVNLFRLEGKISELRENRTFWYFLNSSFSVTRVEDSYIDIGVNPEDLESSYSAIEDYLVELGHEVQRDKAAQSGLEKVLRGIEDFEIHSQKAKTIYWGKIESSEMVDFLSHIDNSFISGRKLDQFQALSAYHLAFSLNGCNFSVPGSGKTTTVYAAYSYLKSKKIVDKLLVIGPQSCFSPWELEYQECFAKEVSSIRANKLSVEERRNFFRSKVEEELVLLGFQSLANHKEDVQEFLRLNDKVMVVVDEAHNIKRVEGGIWAPAVISIAPLAASRVILTGTPAPNGYEDLYNLFEFIWPNKQLINLTIGQLNQLTKESLEELIGPRGRRRINSLVESLKPYFVRVRKSDLGLPKPIIHPTIYVDMGDLQRSIYETMEDNIFQRSFGENISEGMYNLLKAQTIRLRQAATNPNLLNSGINHQEDFDYSEKYISEKIKNYSTYEIPEKFKTAKDLIKSILSRDEKVIVWGVFVENLLLMEKYLSQNNIPSKVIFGEVPVEGDIEDQNEDTRESIIKEFHNPDSEFKVIIANAATVGESISLHKACNNAIYLERDFNAASFLQSKDRIHRKGLPEGIETNYYFIEAKNTIDEDISERLAKKVGLLEGIIEHPIPLFSNFEEESMEDIKAVFRKYESKQK